jgi:Mg2+ and Co2+ transporter CorA
MIDEEYLIYVRNVDSRLKQLFEHLQRTKKQTIELVKYKDDDLYDSICRSTNVQNFGYISHLSSELIYCLRALRDKVNESEQ